MGRGRTKTRCRHENYGTQDDDVRCDAEKCKRSGNDKREIRVDFKPLEPVMLAQMIKCPYCGGAIERNIPGKVVRVVGDKYTDRLSVFPPRL
jgi:hypothetical protein